ncbi:hypothetical protein GURASL_33920 [Geotalea uraniireducens]|uniref:Uncharacterized protein n=1 Tax=Geotalea uraniireducens TaxID=351604 RepID=A0ABN6VVV5_9BACT|nr:hypothetical protein [Geotalea uraniireducens]BDV44469.1 hypothetical protein GURASL_33920 [Geotalea uraniireducens]
MTTTLNDLVMVHIDEKPAFYARIEDVSPDVKPGWWRVKLLVLTVPLEIYTWILEESQINGALFTMGGTPVRMEKVVSPLAGQLPPDQTPPAPPADEPGAKAKGVKVVPLFERKKET